MFISNYENYSGKIVFLVFVDEVLLILKFKNIQMYAQ